jgi:hypothetical protein
MLLLGGWLAMVRMRQERLASELAALRRLAEERA